MERTALVTGAYGYLGSLIRNRLEEEGWKTTALVRRPRPGDRAVAWSLGEAPPPEALRSCRALVHCAYDFHPRSLAASRRVNFEGTELLLRAAGEAGISRTLVLSSMSAYPGTHQIYGRVKLAIEAATMRAGGIAIRPGLVYGDSPGGMTGALVKLGKLPLAPDFGPAARQFPVHEDDLAGVVVAILEAPGWTTEVFGVAQPRSVSFRSLISSLSAGRSRRPRFVRTPWWAAFGALRLAEALRLTPLRADSLLGLVRPASAVPPSAAFPELLSGLREMAPVARDMDRVPA